jgi:putative heme-binding domain-containing protein
LNGVLAQQSADAVMLRDASGAEWPLDRKQIREIRQQSVSIMPEGLEAGLTEEEFRDLLAFLQGLK